MLGAAWHIRCADLRHPPDSLEGITLAYQDGRQVTGDVWWGDCPRSSTLHVQAAKLPEIRVRGSPGVPGASCRGAWGKPVQRCRHGWKVDRDSARWPVLHDLSPRPVVDRMAVGERGRCRETSKWP